VGSHHSWHDGGMTARTQDPTGRRPVRRSARPLRSLRLAHRRVAAMSAGVIARTPAATSSGVTAATPAATSSGVSAAATPAATSAGVVAKTPAAPLPVETPEVAEAPDIEDVPEIDRPWVTVVWNDPINLMSYVTWVFQKLFGYSKDKAEQLMLDVH